MSTGLLVHERIEGGPRRISVIKVGDAVIVALSKPERMALIMTNTPADGRLLTLDSARCPSDNSPSKKRRQK